MELMKMHASILTVYKLYKSTLVRMLNWQDNNFVNISKNCHVRFRTYKDGQMDKPTYGRTGKMEGRKLCPYAFLQKGGDNKIWLTRIIMMGKYH